jgi:hypothetical protein
VGEQALIQLIGRIERRLDAGATAAQAITLELVPFLETDAERAS